MIPPVLHLGKGYVPEPLRLSDDQWAWPRADPYFKASIRSFASATPPAHARS